MSDDRDIVRLKFTGSGRAGEVFAPEKIILKYEETAMTDDPQGTTALNACRLVLSAYARSDEFRRADVDGVAVAAYERFAGSADMKKGIAALTELRDFITSFSPGWAADFETRIAHPEQWPSELAQAAHLACSALIEIKATLVASDASPS